MFCVLGVGLYVTRCYKLVEEKGKVLPSFADKLISIDFRPLEEAWLWQAFHRWVLAPEF